MEPSSLLARNLSRPSDLGMLGLESWTRLVECVWSCACQCPSQNGQTRVRTGVVQDSRHFFLEWDTRQVGNDFSTGVHRPTSDQPIWRTLFPFLGSLLHFLGFRILSHHQRFNIIKSKMIYTGYILAEIFCCSFAPCTRTAYSL